MGNAESGPASWADFVQSVSHYVRPSNVIELLLRGSEKMFQLKQTVTFIYLAPENTLPT